MAPDTEAAVPLGQQIRERREEVGLTQVQLGVLARVHRGTIRNVENTSRVASQTLRRILAVLGCDPEILPEHNHNGRLARAVLPARMVKRLLEVIQNLHELRQPNAGEGVDPRLLLAAETALDDYLDLVNAASRALQGQDEPFPTETLRRFRSAMAHAIPPGWLTSIDEVLTSIFYRRAPRAESPILVQHYDVVSSDTLLLRIVADLSANGIPTPGLGENMEEARRLVGQLLALLSPTATRSSPFEDRNTAHQPATPLADPSSPGGA